MKIEMLNIVNALGLNKNESETFLTLLDYKDGVSVLDLSKDLNLPRPTIYSHLEKILDLGIAKKGIKENTSLFYPESKDTIKQVLNEKISFLENSKKVFDLAFEEDNKNLKFKPKFFIYEGKNSYEQIWRDILRTREDSYWLWPIKNMIDKGVSKDKLQEFHEERIRRNINLFVLWSEKSKLDIKNSPFLLSNDQKESLRKIRILPKGLDQDIGYGIYGNKVAFISYGEENYSFVIESRELAKTLKQQFDFFWKMSKQV